MPIVEVTRMLIITLKQSNKKHFQQNRTQKKANNKDKKLIATNAAFHLQQQPLSEEGCKQSTVQLIIQCSTEEQTVIKNFLPLQIEHLNAETKKKYAGTSKIVSRDGSATFFFGTDSYICVQNRYHT